jgi:mRNA interferase MazF
MKRLFVTCDRFDVVVVPFPFSEQAGSKRRPAVVISNRNFNAAGYTVLAMITTKGHHPWPGDHTISDLAETGLPLHCIVRLKLFTLDNRLILRQLGGLSDSDRGKVESNLDKHLR